MDYHSNVRDACQIHGCDWSDAMQCRAFTCNMQSNRKSVVLVSSELHVRKYIWWKLNSAVFKPRPSACYSQSSVLVASHFESVF